MQVRGNFLTAVLALAVVAGGCSTTTEITGPSSSGVGGTSPGPPAGLENGCDATKVQWAVGQRASEDLLRRAQTAAGAKVARFVRPDQAITREYLGTRLNLALNEQDVVRGATCG
jgi:hypothetical protein